MHASFTSAGRVIRAIGHVMYPNPAIRGHDAAVNLRIGLLAVFYTVSAAIALTLSVMSLHADRGVGLPEITETTPGILVAALLLVAISVFAPQAIFRTGATSSARRILTSPSVPIQPWAATTIRFNAVLVGAMLGGLYVQPSVALILVAVAYLVRMLVLNRVSGGHDANIRYHLLHHSWSMLIMSVVAYAIVRPLSSEVINNHSVIPLLLAAIVSMYVGLGMDAIDRWARMDKAGWLIVREAVDGRRLLVAVVSAGIAWLVTIAGNGASMLMGDGNATLPIVTALIVFIACWLLLWIASISVWRAEAERTLRLWGTHQVEIATRLADGSLAPDLAAKAALPTTSRMAIVIFGASQALTVHDDGRSRPQRHLAFADRHERIPRVVPESSVLLSGLRVPVYSSNSSANASSVTIWGCLAPGWFGAQSKALLQKFSELATTTMVTPMLTQANDHQALAYDSMFDQTNHWPNMNALLQSLNHMAARFDRSPHLASLVLGVYGIDEFPAIAGGRYEHAAIGHVMRAALANPAFTSFDVFVAYENPGRIWVALSGGPVIRNSIQLLRDLQEGINNQLRGASTNMDLDIFVSVSFGYAAHQVDDLTTEGLAQTALDRLAVDQAARNPFTVPDFSTLDIRPEQVHDVDAMPVTVENLLDGLRADRHTQRFITELTAIRRPSDDSVEGLLIGVGWARQYRHFDMRVPENFLKAMNRQIHLAALAAQIQLDVLIAAMSDLDAAGLPASTCLIRMPSILLNPDAGDLSLPNLVVPVLDLATSVRTVLVFEELPSGAGQAVRMLVDRGIQVAVTAAAAAGAESADLVGWPRWGIILPPSVVQSTTGVDNLTIQQTSSACATQMTRLIAVTSGPLDRETAMSNGIALTIDRTTSGTSTTEALHPDVEQIRQRLHLTS
jgi:hypothetical protein